MDITALRSLAEQLEKATGGYGDLDFAIRTTLVPRNERTGEDEPYSSSIDAAVNLTQRLLPGWAFNICFRADGDTTGDVAGWSVEFRRPYEWLPFSTAPTAPLAILRALVAALIAKAKA